jgi:aspartate/methionine/tyrosine aminotransferase
MSQLLEAKRREGRAVLDLTVSNPTAAGLGWPPPALLGALADDRAARHDPDPRGPAAAREAVAAHLASRGFVEPGRVFLTASTSEAYAHLFRLLCEPGDEVLIPRPSYPLIEPIARLECVRVVPYRLAYDGRWRLDVDSLEASAGPRTRAVVVVQPNNPTGSCLDAREIERVAALCVARGLAIVSDEVFGEFPWSPEARSLPSLANATQAPTFTLGGISKTCGLPQMKVAWIVASGSEESLAPLLPGLEWILDLFLSVGAPAALALPEFLKASDAFRAAMRARIAQNLRALRSVATRSGGRVEVYEGDGGWTAIARVEFEQAPEAASGTHEDLAEWALSRHDVHLHPAHFYDLARDDLAVVSLVTDPDILGQALSRIVG